MSQWLKVCIDMCVCVYVCEDASECVCMCVHVVSSGVCRTGVIELRGFSVFGGRGEIGIFRIH